MSDKSQPKTPNRSQSIGSVRVIHPHHPLFGKIVKVHRQTNHPAHAERRWIITLPDGSPGGIPHSWALPVEDYTQEILPPKLELWVGVTGLLSLVKICAQLKSESEEVADEPAPEPTCDDPGLDAVEDTPNRDISGLDQAARSEPSGDADYPGRHASQLSKENPGGGS